MRVVLLALVVLSFYSCSKATSKPEYKYMKAVGNGTAAEAGDIKITEEELYQGIEGELYDAEMEIFKIKFNRVKQLIIERLVKTDPQAKGLSNDEFFNKYISSTVKVSDKEINEFIKQRKIPAQQLNPQVMEKIKGFLTMQKRESAIENWLGSKVGKKPINIYFTKPKRPTFKVDVGNAPLIGGKNAKVTIVEFSDFQCPYCAEGSKVLQKLKKKYGSKIKVAMKQFPLPFHTQAKKASSAALCLNEQGSDKFWKMHDALFADQSKLKPEDLKAMAKNFGANMEKFDKCFSAGKYLDQIEKDIAQGKSLGVKSTPTFFVNGQLVRGALPVEDFSEIIDQELSL